MVSQQFRSPSQTTTTTTTRAAHRRYHHQHHVTRRLPPSASPQLQVFVVLLLVCYSGWTGGVEPLSQTKLLHVQAQSLQERARNQKPPPLKRRESTQSDYPQPTTTTITTSDSDSSSIDQDDYLEAHSRQNSKKQHQAPPQTEKEKVNRQLLAPFDTDIRQDCRSLLTHCQSDIFSHAYLQCPAMCTLYLAQEGMKGTANSDNTEALWEVGTLRTIQGKRIDADRFEGYVTVISILPMLPGMAFYYYEMMETLHAQFDPKVEFVILPIDVGEGIHIKMRKGNNKPAKVVILEEESAIETHPWVQHLTSIRPRSGAASKNHRGEVVQVDLPTDRLTVYIVSADGYFVERMTVPTMAALQKTIGIYLKTMGYDDL